MSFLGTDSVRDEHVLADGFADNYERKCHCCRVKNIYLRDPRSSPCSAAHLLWPDTNHCPFWSSISSYVKWEALPLWSLKPFLVLWLSGSKTGYQTFSEKFRHTDTNVWGLEKQQSWKVSGIDEWRLQKIMISKKQGLKYDMFMAADTSARPPHSSSAFLDPCGP